MERKKSRAYKTLSTNVPHNKGLPSISYYKESSRVIEYFGSISEEYEGEREKRKYQRDVFQDLDDSFYNYIKFINKLMILNERKAGLWHALGLNKAGTLHLCQTQKILSLDWVIFVAAVYCKTFSSIPCLYPLDARSSPPFVTTKNVSSQCHVPWGSKSPQFRTTALDQYNFVIYKVS